MVRTQGPPTDDLHSRRGRADRNPYADSPLPLDAGLTEADDPDEPQQFRRAARRVPVKRGALALPRRIAARVKLVVLLALGLAVLATAAYQVREFALHSGRFRLRSERDIELAGDAPKSAGPVMEKMREELGRNIFLVSIDERKQELEKIPWVESATVMRLWPNRLRVAVTERTPVAYVAIGGRIGLIDAGGVVMELSPGVPSDYTFPVIRGMADSDPLSTGAARMRTFVRLLHELDGEEPTSAGQSANQSEIQSAGPGKVQYSRNLEEVELSDPEDVKVTVKGPSGPILLHLGNENFLPRFMIYLSNAQKWEHERGKLESVDLRYGRQVILNPDMSAAPELMPSKAAMAKAATAKATPRPSKPTEGLPGTPARIPHVATPVTPRTAAHPKPAPSVAANAKVAKARLAKSKVAKKPAAPSRPQRDAAAKQRTWRGKKPT